MRFGCVLNLPQSSGQKHTRESTNYFLGLSNLPVGENKKVVVLRFRVVNAFSHEISTVQFFMRSPTGNRSRERERERERERPPEAFWELRERSGWDGGRFLLARKIFGSAFALQCNFPKHVLDNTRFRFPVVAISREPNTFPLNKCTRPIALHS